MNENKTKNLNLQFNWRFRFFLFVGVFVLVFVMARFLFKTDLDFSLFLSFTLGIFNSITIFGGFDKHSIKKYFPEYHYQSFAYIKVNPLFYCPGRIVITKDKFVFITNKYNAKPNRLEIDFREIESFDNTKSIILKQGIRVNVKNGQSLKFCWVEDISRCFEIWKTRAQ